MENDFLHFSPNNTFRSIFLSTMKKWFVHFILKIEHFLVFLYFLLDLERMGKENLETPKFVEDGKLGVAEKSRVEIFCRKPVGLPIPLIWWESPSGKRILGTDDTSTRKENSNVSVLPNSQTLVIENIRRNQSGNYSCVAQNIEGTTRSSIELIIASKFLYNILLSFILLFLYICTLQLPSLNI